MTLWRSPLWHLRNLRTRAVRKVWTTLPPWLVRVAVSGARRKLAKLGPVRVLIDVTVRYHAVTHETAWVQPSPYTGYAARVPVHRADTDTLEFRNIKYLAGIAELARTGHLDLLSSAELENEEFRQPSDRFRGYGYSDHSLFSGLRLESVDGHAFPSLGLNLLGLPSAKEQQRARLREHERTFLEYGALVKALGRKNSADAWHLFTAERHGLFCYLTMDFAFVATMKAQARNPAVRALRTLVLTPAELAERFGIRPVSPHLLSYMEASFLVHPELSMPENRRRRRKDYRSSSRG